MKASLVLLALVLLLVAACARPQATAIPGQTVTPRPASPTTPEPPAPTSTNTLSNTSIPKPPTRTPTSTPSNTPTPKPTLNPVVDFIDTKGFTGRVSLRFTVASQKGPVDVTSLEIEQEFNLQATGNKRITEYISNQHLAPFIISQLETDLFEVTFDAKWPGRFILVASSTDSDGGRGTARVPVEVYWSKQPFQFRGVMLGGIVFPYDHADVTTVDFESVLDDLMSMNINFVSVNPVWLMSEVNSNEFMRAPSRRVGQLPLTSISDTQLRELIDLAHARGMGVQIKPMVFFSDRTSTIGWQDVDDPSVWLANYGSQVLLPMARLAAEKGVEMLALLNDQGRINRYRQEWIDLIHRVRSVYDGIILPAEVNFPDRFSFFYEELSFTDAIDMYGFQSYLAGSGNPGNNPRFPTVSGALDPTVEQMAEHIAANFEAREEEATSQDLAGVATEFGLNNVDLANWWPVSNTFAREQGDKGAIDNQEQIEFYEASFRVFAERGWIKGAFLWSTGLKPPITYINRLAGVTHDVRSRPLRDMIRIWFHTE